MRVLLARVGTHWKRDLFNEAVGGRWCHLPIWETSATIAMPGLRRSKRAHKDVNYNVDQTFREMEADAAGAEVTVKTEEDNAAPRKQQRKSRSKPSSGALRGVKVEDDGFLSGSDSSDHETSSYCTKPVTRRKDGTLCFEDYPHFRPNLAPFQVMQLGSFGGTYWRPIKSSVVGQKLKDQHKEFPEEWFQG